MKLKVYIAALHGALLCLLLLASHAQAGKMSLIGAGNSVSGGGGGRTCTDDTASTNFLTQTGGSAPNYGAGSARYADAYCTFIKALETAGLISGNLSGTNSCGAFTGNTIGWAGVWLMKANTSANSLLNICGTASPLVNHGATFTADSGYVGSGSNYIDSQVVPGSANFLQNNASLWVATSTTFTAGVDYGSMAGNGASLNIRLYPQYTANRFFSAVNQTTLNTDSTNVSQPGKLYGATRSSSSQMEDYINSTSSGLQTWTSAAPVGTTIALLNDGTASTAPFTGTATFAAIGGGLTTAQESALQSAVATYVASVP